MDIQIFPRWFRFEILTQSAAATSPQERGSTDAGFTLIELLTVIATIGVLASLAITSFQVYRASAAYAVATKTYRDARNAFESSIADTSNLPGQVDFTSVSVPGPVTAAGARSIMPGMQIPKKLQLQMSYDPTCADSSCNEAFLSARHCLGKQYLYWFRRGDGVEMLIENVAGAGFAGGAACS